ncbi:tyrosine-protein phosphatase [Nonomuraea zeae]
MTGPMPAGSPRARVVAWPGCLNARDLGGLPIERGGATRAGVLFRADRPRAQSVEAILAHGVSRVLDLRLDAEARADPSPLAGMPVYRRVSVLRPEDTELEAMGESLPEIYRAILDRGRANLAAALGAIARAPAGGVLVHCHSGRDRTGLVVALALSLAGVPDAEIAADYALTATFLRPEVVAAPRSVLLFAEITAATMLATVAHLRRAYGGAEPYLLGGGLRPEEVALIRDRLGCA